MRDFIGGLLVLLGVIVAFLTVGFAIWQLGGSGGSGDYMMIIVYVLVLIPVLLGVLLSIRLVIFGMKVNGKIPTDKPDSSEGLPDLKTLYSNKHFRRKMFF